MADQTVHELTPKDAYNIICGRKNVHILRRSSTLPGAISLSYTDSVGEVGHARILARDGGFFLEGKFKKYRTVSDLLKDCHFDTTVDRGVIDRYQTTVKDLFDEAVFQADLTQHSHARSVLRGSPIGTYLLRPNQSNELKSTAIALSYVRAPGRDMLVASVGIQITDEGQFILEGFQFATFSDMLDHLETRGIQYPGTTTCPDIVKYRYTSM